MRQITRQDANGVNQADGQSEVSWQLLMKIAAYRRQNGMPGEAVGFLLDDNSELIRCAFDSHAAQLLWQSSTGITPGPQLALADYDLISLYGCLFCATAHQPVVIGHLGQSLDGQIATSTGDSYFVTGEENLRHLHRMRALCDAIVVGANTVADDNPRLTTRLVPGPNPVRVVLDPSGRLKQPRHVFDDDAAPTMSVQAGNSAGANGTDYSTGQTEIIRIASDNHLLCPLAVRAALTARGLHAIFVEGGGLTVSGWLNAGALTRLQLACAPVLIGQGRPGIQIPGVARMQASLRPAYGLYQMGEDVMWDFDLSEHNNRA